MSVRYRTQFCGSCKAWRFPLRYDRSVAGRVIAGDVGGTKTLLRCIDVDGNVAVEGRFDSQRFTSFSEVLRGFLERCGSVEGACFAVAGAVVDGRAEVTNLKWRVDAGELERAFSIPHVDLINDFYAVAVGVPLMRETDLVSLQRGQRDLKTPIAILGAGTGLGQAFLVPHDGHWVVVPSEGGHADFAPQDEEQARLLLWLRERHGRVSTERVVSGIGLTNIYEFLTGTVAEPAVIAASDDPAARRTREIFVDTYGAEAGNMGLKVLARGGVFLAGGIAAKNIAWFQDGRFIEAFRRKGRFSSLMDTMPVDVIVNEQVGLIGAAAVARQYRG